MALSWLETGKEYFANKEYAKAIIAFKKTIKEKDKNFLGQACFELGKTCLILNKYTAANKYLLKASRLKTSNPHSRILLGKSFKFLGDYKKAIHHFKKARELNPLNLELEKELSEIYANLNKRRSERRPVHNENILELCRNKIRDIQNLNYEGKTLQVLEKAKILEKDIPKDHTSLRNIARSEIEIAEGKIALKSRARYLNVILTNRCNLKCVMCERKDEKKWDLPGKSVKELYKTLPYLEKVLWQGGEVFLYKDFESLLSQFGKYKIKQAVLTNGLLLTKPLMLKLIKYNVDMIFSIDGTTKKLYEEIRRGANFGELTKKLRLFNTLKEKMNSGLSMHLNAVIINKNYRQAEKFVDFAKNYGFNSMSFMPLNCESKLLMKKLGVPNDTLTRRYLKNSFERIEKKAKNQGINFNQWILPPDSLSNKNEPLTGHISSREKKLFCHIPWTSLFIDSKGDVKPSCFCWHNLGNMKYDSIKHMWNGKKMHDYRSKLVSSDIGDFCNTDCLKRLIPEPNLKFVL